MVADAAPVGLTVAPRPGRSEWVLDERGRSLRATWHPEAGRVVLSLWTGHECVGTVRLTGPDAARIAALLAGAVEDWSTDRLAET